MTPIFETRDLTVRFGGVTAVDGAALAVEPGQIVGLIGPNGAGKTTLLGACSGYVPNAQGSVRLEGAEILGLAPERIAQRGLVRTFQGTRAVATMTVAENVLAGSNRLGRSGAWGALVGSRRARAEERAARDRTAHLVERVGLEDAAGQFPSDLSGGRLRLLEIARVLAAEPKVVLLDEPAAGLSRTETARLEELLRSLRDDGLSSVLVEHDVELVLGVCDTVVVLDHGAVIASGAPEAVRRDPRVIDAYLGPRVDVKEVAGA